MGKEPKKRNGLRDLWGNINPYNLCVTEVPKIRKSETEAEKQEKIIAKNFRFDPKI